MSAWYAFILLVHLSAMALWLGGIVFFLLVMRPAVRELESRTAATTLNRARIGLESASWTAIGLLLLTGIANLMLRTSAGAMTLDRTYGVLFGLKLVVFGAMVLHHSLQAFKYAPQIASMTAELPPAAAAWPEPLLSQWRRWFRLLKINAALGPVAVLLGLSLTAL